MSQLNMKPEIDLQEGLDIYQAKMDAAITALGQKGFGPPNMPQYMTQAGQMYYRGELPSDLTSLNDDQLGTYMGLLSEWNAYVQFQLAEADSQLTHAKAQLVLVEAKLRLSYQRDSNDKKRSNPERDDYVGSDRRYVEANGNLLYREGIWRYTKAIAFSAEQAFSAVSRRITQRGQEVERDRRNGGINQGTNAPTGPLFGPRRV